MKVGFLGIGGTGVRALAHIMHAQGVSVVGTDTHIERLRSDDALSEFELLSEQDFIGQLESCDHIIHTDAAPSDHPVLQAANQHALPIQKYNEALGDLSRDYRTIAVAGTHGKSTTTALVAHILIKAGMDPTVIVGAPIPAFGNANARVGESDVLVVEADEYRGHFLTLTPSILIITNIEHDHPDHFTDLAAVQHTFEQFLTKLDEHSLVVTTQSTRSDHSLHWPEKTETPSSLERNEIPNLHGDHMRSNAALAIAAAVHLGVKREDAIAHLMSFEGIGRRLESLGTLGSLHVLSDYGHHPAEITATLSALREQYADKQICALWEPHTLDRVNSFGDEFAAALSSADGALIAPIYAPQGRDSSHSDAVADATLRLQELFSDHDVNAQFISTFSELKTMLQTAEKSFDVCVAFSAGALDGHLRDLL